MYPGPEAPDLGVFVKQIADVLEQEGNEVDRVVIDRRGGTPAKYGLLAARAAVAARRFRPADWNIYAAQASDGDNSYADGEVTGRLLTDKILPVSQFFAYLEVGQENGLSYEMPNSSLWTLYEGLRASGAPLSMRKVNERSEIFPVFHDLFQRRSQQERTGS